MTNTNQAGELYQNAELAHLDWSKIMNSTGPTSQQGQKLVVEDGIVLPHLSNLSSAKGSPTPSVRLARDHLYGSSGGGAGGGDGGHANTTAASAFGAAPSSTSAEPEYLIPASLTRGAVSKSPTPSSASSALYYEEPTSLQRQKQQQAALYGDNKARSVSPAAAKMSTPPATPRASSPASNTFLAPAPDPQFHDIYSEPASISRGTAPLQGFVMPEEDAYMAPRMTAVPSYVYQEMPRHVAVALIYDLDMGDGVEGYFLVRCKDQDSFAITLIVPPGKPVHYSVSITLRGWILNNNAKLVCAPQNLQLIEVLRILANPRGSWRMPLRRMVTPKGVLHEF